MTFYDYDNEKLRAQIRRRYTRRFFLGAHGAVLIFSMVLAVIVPELALLLPLAVITFIPHALYVAYHEYHYWVEHKIDKKIYGDPLSVDPHTTTKRKRYADDFVDEPTFRLTDDGEIEEVPPTFKAKRGQTDYTVTQERDSRRERSSSKKRDHDKKRRKKDKKRRKFDTDEFDVKKLLKKFKDIID